MASGILEGWSESGSMWEQVGKRGVWVGKGDGKGKREGGRVKEGRSKAERKEGGQARVREGGREVEREGG